MPDLTPAQQRYEDNQRLIPEHDAPFEQTYGRDAGKPQGDKR